MDTNHWSLTLSFIACNLYEIKLDVFVSFTVLLDELLWDVILEHLEIWGFFKFCVILVFDYEMLFQIFSLNFFFELFKSRFKNNFLVIT